MEKWSSLSYMSLFSQVSIHLFCSLTRLHRRWSSWCRGLTITYSMSSRFTDILIFFRWSPSMLTLMTCPCNPSHGFLLSLYFKLWFFHHYICFRSISAGIFLSCFFSNDQQEQLFSILWYSCHLKSLLYFKVCLCTQLINQDK